MEGELVILCNLCVKSCTLFVSLGLEGVERILKLFNLYVKQTLFVYQMD